MDSSRPIKNALQGRDATLGGTKQQAVAVIQTTENEGRDQVAGKVEGKARAYAGNRPQCKNTCPKCLGNLRVGHEGDRECDTKIDGLK